MLQEGLSFLTKGATDNDDNDDDDDDGDDDDGDDDDVELVQCS